MSAPIYPEPSKAEQLTWELSQSSYKGQVFLSLATPRHYRDRFCSSASTPVSSLTASLTKPHSSTDTVVYFLPPHFGVSSTLAIFDNLWRLWYTRRPLCTRLPDSIDDWANGSRFLGVPVKVDDVSEEWSLLTTLSVLCEVHVLLGTQVRANQRCASSKLSKTGIPKKGIDYYENGPSRSFQRCFIVIDDWQSEGTTKDDMGKDKLDEMTVLLGVSQDSWAEANLSVEGDGCLCKINYASVDTMIRGAQQAEVAQKEKQWGVWRMPLEAVVQIVAKIDDVRRVEQKATLSKQYVRRFGESGMEVLVGSEVIPGVVSP